MSIDFKPAVRFLKLDKMGAKCAEIGKNIAAYAKHHPALTGGIVVMLGALNILEPSVGAVMTGASIWALNGAGKYDRKRDEIAAERAGSNKPLQLSL